MELFGQSHVKIRQHQYWHRLHGELRYENANSGTTACRTITFSAGCTPQETIAELSALRTAAANRHKESGRETLQYH